MHESKEFCGGISKAGVSVWIFNLKSEFPSFGGFVKCLRVPKWELSSG